MEMNMIYYLISNNHNYNHNIVHNNRVIVK